MTKKNCLQFRNHFPELVTCSVIRRTVSKNLTVLLLALALPFFVFAQERIITGHVNDAETGDPVVGATVSIKGKSTGVITDALGAFKLKATDSDVIEISSVGYQTQEMQAGNAADLQIKLKVLNKQLNEVVVVGYGTKKRSDVTGSVATVPKNRLEKLPVTNILHAIEGSVAGVNITQFSSVPGSSANVLVRGQNSLNGGTGPFIVVDGVPFSKTGSVTNDINPNDIASIEILKDASATAIYGVNGANGVILITTKRGATGKPVIRYNGYVGFDNISKTMTPLSPAEYVQKYADWWKQTYPTTTQGNVLPNAYEIANFNAGKTTDWLEEVTQQGIMQDHNLSISGGNKEVKYYISGDYLKQKGAVQGYSYSRANLRANLDVNVTDFLTMGTSLFFNNNNYGGGRSNFYLAAAMSPYGTLRNTAGAYEIYPMNPELLYKNPMLGLYTDREDKSSNLNGNVFAEVKLGGVLKGLKYRLNTGYTYFTTRYAYYEGRNTGNTIGSGNVSSSETNSYVVENILTYNKDFGLHHIDFTGLYSGQQRKYFTMSASASNFINDELSFSNLGAGATQTAGSYRDKYNLASQMARVNYTYGGKYLLTLTARRDGSSVMGGNTDKYGLFPSFALGWNISREKFMDRFAFLNNLKLRVSYGKSGNEAISVYQTITTDATVRFPFNGAGLTGVLASNLGNANLHWETSKTFNAGIDFAILKNRINGTIDLYETNSEDLLLRRSLPVITGYSFVWDNLGKTRNTGIEVMINTENVVTKDFKWGSILNFSSNKNRIVELYGDGKDDLGNRWYLGHPIGIIYDYKMVGVWQVGEDASAWDPSAKPGDLKFQDTNGDKKITSDDRVILGQTAPKWIGGFTNTFSYKNLTLSVFIQTVQGAMKNNVALTYADEAGRMNIFKETGYWTAENKNNTRPALSYTNTRGYGYASDNSYTRIKDVSLSYSFSKAMLDKLKLGSLTCYVSGRNLYTFTKWIGWDPEHNYSFRGSGDWTNNYPITRQVVFGMNVTLR